MWINKNYRKNKLKLRWSYRMELQDKFTTNRTYHPGGNLVLKQETIKVDEAEERIAAKFIQNSWTD